MAKKPAKKAAAKPAVTKAAKPAPKPAEPERGSDDIEAEHLALRNANFGF